MFRNRLTQPRPRHATRYRPHLDPLEERALLSLTTFAVDDTQSFLTLSGGVGSIQLMPQAPGSLVTAYTGNLQADVDFANGLIRFVKGDGIMAENSGDWQPRADGSLGAEPADYGGQINFLGMARFAFRDVDLKLSSRPLPLTPLDDGVSYGFPNSQHIKMHRGRVAYNHPLIGPGTTGLGRFAGDNDADSRGNASYVTDVNGDGSALELHLAIDFSFTARIQHIQVNLNLDGMIVATGSLGTGPASHGARGSNAAFGTALVVGARAHGQALVSHLPTNPDGMRAPEIQATTFVTTGTTAVRAGYRSTHSSAGHQAATDLLDAAFAGLSPMEFGMTGS